MRRSAGHSIRRSVGEIGAIVPLLLMSGVILACPRAGRAQAVNDTWNGGNGQWNVAGNWNNGIPNNSGTTTYNVFIDGSKGDNAVVTISGINPTISNLTVDAGNSLILGDNQSLTIAGGTGAGSLDIAGTLNLGSAGNTSDLILSGANATITLSGGGTLSLSDFAQNRIYGSGSQTLVNSAGNTIQGSGQLGIGGGSYGFMLNNAGLINANQSVALNVNPGNTTNTGTMEASNSGTLNLGGVVTNTGGIILSTGSGSVVNLAGDGGSSTITGGTLTTASGGAMTSNGSTLSGLTISAGSTVTTSDNANTTLTGSITNNGTIALNSAGNTTSLILSGGAAVELTGGGSITMSAFVQNRIYGSGTDALTVHSCATIQGSGQVGIGGGGYAFTLNNAGTINSNSGTMYVNPGTLNNTSLIEATNGAPRQPRRRRHEHRRHDPRHGAGSVVNLAGDGGSSTITGGTLTTASGGAMTSNGSTLSGLTISAGSTVTTPDNTNTTLTGSITDKGTIALNSAGNTTSLILNGGAAVELTGGGSITMSGFFQNRIYGSGTDTLRVDSGATIQGGGQVGIGGGYTFTLNNAGTINANQSGVALQLAPSSTVSNTNTNTNVMEATNGGILTVAAPFTNTGGTIQAVGSGSVVNFSGASVTGGTLTASGGGTMATSNSSTLSDLSINVGLMTSSNSTFNNVTISSGSTIQPQDNSSTTLQGTVTDKGTIALNSAGNTTSLILNGGAAVELTGGGSITMSNFAQNRIYGSGTDTLTVHSCATIQGSGQVGIGGGGYAFTLNNAGTVDANQSVALNVNPGSTTNTGTLEATGGGTLNLGGGVTNTGGIILSTGSGSVVNLAGDGGSSTITGGTLTTTSGGAMTSNGSTLSGLTISAGSTVTTPDNTNTTLTGSITDKGTIALNSAGNTTSLILNGGAAVELTGGGSITMSNFAQNRIYGSGTDALTVRLRRDHPGLGPGRHRRWRLRLHAQQRRDHQLQQWHDGDQPRHVEQYQPHRGHQRRRAQPRRRRHEYRRHDPRHGRRLGRQPGRRRRQQHDHRRHAHHRIRRRDDQQRRHAQRPHHQRRVSTVSTPDNTNTTLAGVITNNGTIALNSAGNQTNILLSGNVTLGGTGVLSMSDYIQNRIYGSTGTEQLTNGASHTIEGSGQIGVGLMSLVNNGTILANQSNSLTIDTNSAGAANNGTTQVNGGSSLFVSGGFTTAGNVNIGQLGNSSASLFQMSSSNDYVQTGGTTSLWTSGSTLSVVSGQSVHIEGGLLQGFGIVQGNLINDATVHPGDGPGILTVNGGYTQSSTGLLDIQIGGTNSGSFSELVVNGSASLSGLLDVSLVNGFSPTLNEQWVILTSTGLSGTFTDGVIHEGNYTFTVDYSPAGYANDVVLNVSFASVPEPATFWGFGIGMMAVGGCLLRRGRKAGLSKPSLGQR